MPQTCGNVALVGGQLAHQGHHQHESVFGHGVVAIGFDVGHDDAAFLGGLYVHMLKTRGRDGNHFQVGAGFDGSAVNLDFVGNDDFGIATAVNRFMVGCVIVFGEVVFKIKRPRQRH